MSSARGSQSQELVMLYDVVPRISISTRNPGPRFQSTRWLLHKQQKKTAHKHVRIKIVPTQAVTSTDRGRACMWIRQVLRRL